ncbi:MAG: chromosomal replication initiator protein DnaA [Bacteroidia bacterium]
MAEKENKTAESVWAECLEIIRDNISLQSFKTWFEPVLPSKLSGDVLTIQVPSQFFYEWLEEHYVNLLHKTIKRALGSNGRLEYAVVMENKAGEARPYTIQMPGGSVKHAGAEVTMPVNLGQTIKNPFVIPGLKKVQVESQLNPRYRFDSFVEGDCNRLARSAGLAVAAKPGATSFNPLMLYGSTGLGKTHLAQAIGNQVRQLFPTKTVLYVGAEKFTQQFVDALKNQSANDFVHFYQMMDVLILDDVHNLANKEKTQDVFFHIFNHLHQNGKQLILTSDRPPKDLRGMEDRLLSRFKWGLSTDLQAPDYETRLAILQSKMYADGIDLPADVVEFIAHNINHNIRELEGALTSLMAYTTLSHRQADLELARNVIKNFTRHTQTEISIDSIQAMVCEYFDLPVDLLRASTRKREVVQARQISMYFAKKMTKYSLKAIGEYFGGRDHSTVIHSCQTVEDLMETDRRFRGFVDDIQKRIKSSTV